MLNIFVLVITGLLVLLVLFLDVSGRLDPKPVEKKIRYKRLTRKEAGVSKTYKGYMAQTGSLDAMCIFKSKIVINNKYANALGFTVTKFKPDPYAASSTEQIYFTLSKAKLMQKRINKIVSELEKTK